MSWTALLSKLPYPYIEALRQCIVERALAADESVPASLEDEIDSGFPVLGDWGSDFDDLLDALIPLYVNHADSGGNWDDEAAIVMYSEASMLTAISASERIYSGAGVPLLADWAEQAYAILNKLLWTRNALTLDELKQRYGEASFNTDWPTTWADVTTDYNAAGWTADAAEGDIAQAIGHKSTSEPEGWVGRIRSKLQAAPWTGAKCTIDWYLYVEAPPWGTATWDDDGEGLTEDALWRFQSADGPDDSATRTSNFPTSSETMPPEPDDPGGTITKGWWASAYYAVLKWDVTGGFAYV